MLSWPAPVSAGDDPPSRALRRGLMWLAGLTTAGIALELAIERHWTQPIQFVAWASVVSMVLALVSLRTASVVRVRIARILAVLVGLSGLLGIWEHVAANYDAGPLDFHYTNLWATLPEVTRWWLAATRTVGPSPPLAPGALALAALALLLASLRPPTRTSAS